MNNPIKKYFSLITRNKADNCIKTNRYIAIKFATCSFLAFLCISVSMPLFSEIYKCTGNDIPAAQLTLLNAYFYCWPIYLITTIPCIILCSSRDFTPSTQKIILNLARIGLRASYIILLLIIILMCLPLYKLGTVV